MKHHRAYRFQASFLRLLSELARRNGTTKTAVLEMALREYGSVALKRIVLEVGCPKCGQKISLENGRENK